MSLSIFIRDEQSIRGPLQGLEDELDAHVHAFEQAYNCQGQVDLAAFLPPQEHPLYGLVLRELVRVDMEYAWERGTPKALAEYQREFPALADDREGLKDIAYEEYRLRRQAGEQPTPEEYLSRYGVHFEPRSSYAKPLLSKLLAREFPIVTKNFPSETGRGSELGPKITSPKKKPRAASAFPNVGEEFLGFQIVRELGQGSFGRVYLATQAELADRRIVLKVTAGGRHESQTLAQLQHENIVPVYSSHSEGRLRAICMPYLGSATLRDVYENLKAKGDLPDSGLGLLSSIDLSTQKNGVALADSSSDTSDGSQIPFHAITNTHESSQSSRNTRLAVSLSKFFKGRSSSPREQCATSAAVDSRKAETNSFNASSRTGTAVEHRVALGAMSYVDAVVWMGAQLANGLAHAHERGILHCDMKPANILLSDDGRPMLLDFNLATDLKHRPNAAGKAAAVGGTLPYMAPEHLDAFRGSDQAVDNRSDLFSFGVIFYEMLTGRPPFPIREGRRREILPAMINDRLAPPPRLRPWNPAISPGVESIIRRCLEPDASRRYPSARALQEDLERHLAHRSLKHTPDPSQREVFAKWFRRNKAITTTMTVLTLLSLVIGGLAAVLSRRNEQVSRFEAVATLDRFREQMLDCRNLLTVWLKNDQKRLEGEALAKQTLGLFAIREQGRDSKTHPWWQSPPAAKLDARLITQLRQDAGELLVMLARAETPRFPAEKDDKANSDSDRSRYLEAIQDLERAEACLPNTIPGALYKLRANLFEKLGDTKRERQASGKAKTSPPNDALAYEMLGDDLVDHGQFELALSQYRESIRLRPSNYWAHLKAGNCQERMGRNANAEAYLETAIALWPEYPAAYFNRGIVLLNQRQYERAGADFDRVLVLKPNTADAIFNRALAAEMLGQHNDAIAGYSRAIQEGYSETRVYFCRAISRQAVGDLEGARQDREEGLRRVPVDPVSWVARAVARLAGKDIQGALEDLEQALKLDPSSFHALQNKIYILGEIVGLREESLQATDRMVEYYPDNAPTRIARAILLARMNRREEAVADAEKALLLEPGMGIFYQAADVYALTSKTVPFDRYTALGYLGTALGRGFDLNVVATDPDLDPIRSDPTFQQLFAAAVAKSKRERAKNLSESTRNSSNSRSDSLSTNSSQNP